MANQTFATAIEGWARRVKEAEEAVFREASQELVEQLNQQITEMIYEAPESPGYKRTGFLRASLMASTEAMPRLERDNPGLPVGADAGDVILVIAGAELGQTIFLGYTAKYGAMVARGTSKMAPRPWVDLVAQRWPEIVSTVAARVKQRFGL